MSALFIAGIRTISPGLPFPLLKNITTDQTCDLLSWYSYGLPVAGLGAILPVYSIGFGELENLTALLTSQRDSFCFLCEASALLGTIL